MALRRPPGTGRPSHYQPVPVQAGCVVQVDRAAQAQQQQRFCLGMQTCPRWHRGRRTLLVVAPPGQPPEAVPGLLAVARAAVAQRPACQHRQAAPSASRQHRLRPSHPSLAPGPCEGPTGQLAQGMPQGAALAHAPVMACGQAPLRGVAQSPKVFSAPGHLQETCHPSHQQQPARQRLARQRPSLCEVVLVAQMRPPPHTAGPHCWVPTAVVA